MAQRGGWLAAATLAAVAALTQPAPLQRLDLVIYDALEPLARPGGPEPRSAIVAIDEASLAAFGRWPWHRGLHAAVLDRLTDAGAAAVGMAVLFPESADGDAALAAAMQRAGNVVLATAPGTLPGGRGVRDLLPTGTLAEKAAGIGHVDVELDADSLARRTFERAGTGIPAWPALSLAVLHRAEPDGRPPAEAAAPAAANAASWVRAGEMLLPFPGRSLRPPTYSALALLRDAQLAASLRGKAVFVGTTAAGLEAGLATPGSRNASPMPAVEFHARAFDAARSGHVYRSAAPATAAVFTLLMLALPLAVHPLLGLRGAIAGSAFALAPLVASGVILYSTRVWVPPAAATASFVLGHLLWFALYLKQTRGSLLRARLGAEATLRSIADAVITVDGAGRIVLMNEVAEKLAGIGLDRVQGQAAAGFLAGFCSAATEIDRLLADCLRGHGTLRLSEPLEWRRPDGAPCSLRVTLTPIGDGGAGAVLAFNDVTETVAFTARLLYEATHDPLTGLPNRTLLLDRLRQALTQAKRKDSLVALLFVDLDRFKRINDSLGHNWGDHVLKVVAQRLEASVRAGDTVSRWGGDEFIVLLDNVTERNAVASIAGKIVEVLDREIETDDGTSLVASCSIGVGLGPQDSDDAETLLSMADKAMYRGKMEGGGNFTFYAADMNTWSRDRLKMEGALRHALANREFELFFQPQVDIHGNRLVGLESLIRWRKPGAGLVTPATFIPAAEECGVIRSIGEWALHEAAEQVARWSAEGLQPVPLAVNVSARQCSDMGVVEAIRSALACSRIDPGLLKIELTESTTMHNVDFVATLLDSVNRIGVGVAVDDFGTGYSSLSYLKRFPITELKIDKSFVGEIATGGDDAAIVRGTIALAHGLEMTVVAEGVETAAQLEFLAGHHCDVAQGYFFAEPMPASEVRRWLLAPPSQLARGG
ncbi:EAL domain-containing protein [Thauera sinica]|uniref:EAL domain-containing protein n=1 Tax=Thauera sinica TaxID=2665146 RepID=A0ABW1AUR5_9RHOO|nr:EAL domain-containing protein [Thauera sp. K11]